MWSGTDTSLMFDSLKTIGKSQAFQRASAINHSVWPVGASIGSLLGGYLAVLFSFNVTVMISLVPAILSWIVCFALQEPPGVDAAVQQDFSIIKHITRLLVHMKEAIFIAKDRPEVFVLLLSGFVSFCFGEVTHQMEPIFLQTRDVPIQQLGLVSASSFGFSFLGSFVSANVSAILGNKKL